MTKEQSDVLLELHNMSMEPSKVRKNKTTECEKITVTCNIGTAQYEDGTVKCEKKIRKPPNVTKVLSNMILELYNVRTEPSNVRKKIREPSHVTKKLSHVILKLDNVRIKLLNMGEKNRNHQM